MKSSVLVLRLVIGLVVPSIALGALLALIVPGVSYAYVECGNPPGPAENLTATNVRCADARSFARKVAGRRVTRSRSITLPGWRRYYARVRRVGGEYDVRATRGNKVIRFQYRTGRARGRSCDPNYSGACLRPDAYDYDCAGGSGDGPYYTGLVHVVGDDHYDLDRDGDGTACDT